VESRCSHAAQVMVDGTVAHPAATPEPCCRYLQVTIPDSIDCIIAQGPALVRAEALGTIQPSGPFERALARLLLWPPTSVACGPSWRLPLPG
jgi:hypothetical protein